MDKKLLNNMKIFIRKLTQYFWLACLLLTAAPLAYADEPQLPTLRYNLGGTSAWIPYGYFGDPNKQGIFADIVHAIMQHAKISYEFFYYPPKRAELAMEVGKLDFDFMSTDWVKDGNMGDEFVTTIPLFELKEYIVTLPANAANFAQPQAIYGKRVGTIAGYSYHDDNKFTRVDFLSESKLIEGLAKQRFDAVILEGVTASYWAKVHEVNITFAALHSHGDMVIRLRKEHRNLITDFNEAIVFLQQSGELQKIMQSYNLQ